MNEERFVLTDEVWVRLAPHLPGKQGDAGATGNRKDNGPGNIAVLRRRALDVVRRDTSKTSLSLKLKRAG